MTWAWDPFLLPTLCRVCHGAMELEAGFAARCPYCGQRDQLPADQLERALELKDRLAAAARVERQLSGVEEMLVRRYEQPRRPTLMGLSVLLLGAWVLARYLEVLPALHRMEENKLFIQAVAIFSVTALLAIPLGLRLGFTLARWRYRRDTRPLLFARPPEEPGQPARCRVCGGPLPPVSEPVARCLYCASLSLLTPGLHREAMSRAGRGEEQVRGQARRVTAAAVGRGRALAFELGVGWGLAVALIALAMTALTVWERR